MFPSRYDHRKNYTNYQNYQLKWVSALNARIKGVYGQAARPISTGQLHASLRFHLPPIKLVVYQRPLGAYARDTLSWSWLPA